MSNGLVGLISLMNSKKHLFPLVTARVIRYPEKTREKVKETLKSKKYTDK